MEFVFSNKSFIGAQHITPHLYAIGPFSPKNGVLNYLKGFVFDDDYTEKDLLAIDLRQCTPKGGYVFVKYDIQKEILILKTDKRAFINCYIFQHQGKIGISDNPWLLAKIFKEDISIDLDSLYAQMLYTTDIHPHRTLLTHISRIGANTTLIWNIKEGKLEQESNYSFNYHPSNSLSLSDFIDRADEGFTKYFNYIKQSNPNQTAGFGCSGGLDSRLIAYYTQKVGLPVTSFVVARQKPHRLMLSTTALTSKLVAERYNISRRFIEYDEDWLEQSMILDIRNHPFFFSQAFLNPIKELPPMDYMLAGDPGGYAYMADAVLSNSYERLKGHASFYLGMKKDSILGICDIIRKAAHHLHLPVDLSSEHGLMGLGTSTLNRVVPASIQEKVRNELFAIIDELPGDNNIEKWISIHDNMTTKYMASSAYDSMNATKRFYPLYYPFFSELIQELPGELFQNKKFLKALLEYVNSDFLKIPDQNLNRINGYESVYKRTWNRFELAIRGRGLDFLSYLRKTTYKSLVKRCMQKDNPIFNRVVNKQQLLGSGIFFTYAGVQYLKLKMICDIVYYQDFDILFSDNDYSMASW